VVAASVEVSSQAVVKSASNNPNANTLEKNGIDLMYKVGLGVKE
jgi:hypothetical protein